MSVKKGNIPWNKGKKATEAAIKNQSLSHLGKIPWNKGKKNVYTEATLKKMGKKGYRHTAEAKKKISERSSGKNNPFYGKRHTQENLIKISEKRKGIKLSKERVKQMSELLPKGKDHWNWKGGINPINDTIRKSLEVKLWRKACMERDNFTCQKTGIRGGELEVHHINNFASFPELRTSIENGITLSKDAHKEFHKIYGKKNNTKEQLDEFLCNYKQVKV